MSGRRGRVPLALYALLFVLAAVLLPWVGGERLPLSRIAEHLAGRATPEGRVLLAQRLPRVLVGLAVGGALAVAGASLQVLFRNPLAEPWTLGVAGGAALGAFLAHAVPALGVSLGPLHSAQLLTLAGAGLVLGLVHAFSHRPGGAPPQALLLAGITVSILSGGVIMLLSYFLQPYQFLLFHRWMVGGVDVVGYGDLLAMAFLLVPGLWLLFGQAREFNHLALGEELALGQGVDVRRTRLLAFVGAGITSAAAVALAGPIGFVGMIVPHAVRALSGADHRRVLPAAFLLGGTVLAVCDAVARSVRYPTEIPVGIVASVLGAPLFLFILVRRGGGR